MEKNSKKVLTGIVSIILSFLLSIVFTAGSICFGVYIGFLNENRIFDAMNDKDYYTSVEEVFYQNAKDLTIPIGLPEEVVEGIVDSDTIYNDVKGYVVAAVNGQQFEFSTDVLKANLENNVRNYFSSQGLSLSEEQEAALPEYTQMIADEYEATMKFPLVQYFAKAKQLFQKIMGIVLAVCVVLAVIVIIVLLKMQKRKYMGIRYLVYSTSATLLMVAVPEIVAFASGFYKRINVTTEYLYYAVTKYISNGLWVFVYISIVWIVVTIALLLLIRSLKRNSES